MKYSFKHMLTLLSAILWIAGGLINPATADSSCGAGVAVPPFLAAGLFSYFGGPLLATPFLLDLMHLPHDMFQLFLVSGVYCGRLGDALGIREERLDELLGEVRQAFDDPDGDHDWGIRAEVDLAASDAEGAAVVRVLDVSSDVGGL